MEYCGTLWLVTLYMAIFIHSLLFARAVYCHFTRSHIPPGIIHYRKLHFFAFILEYFLELGEFLEKLGICHKYLILRAAYDFLPTRKDPKLITKDLVFDGVPVRVYWPKTPPAVNTRAIIFLHGGAGVIGSIRAVEKVCGSIAHESDSVVVSVEFRLAPEHLYPASVLDCLTAAIHFLKNAKEYGVDPNCIAIGGESSGGTYAAAICQELVARADLPRVRAQLLINPFLQGVDFNLPSHQQNQSVPPFFRERAIKFGLTYLTGKDRNMDKLIKGAHVPPDLREKYQKWISADNIPEEFKARGYVHKAPAPFSEELYEQLKRGTEAMFSPLLAEDNVICQLPEAFILTCEYDVLRDDGLLYKKRLEDNGVPVTWHHLADACHSPICYLGWGLLEFPSSKECLQYVGQFLGGLSK